MGDVFLRNASVFWKNDRPGGLAYMWSYTARKPSEEFEGTLERAMRRYDELALTKGSKQFVKDLLAQLAAIAKDNATGQSTSNVSPDLFPTTTLVNVHWLEQNGFLVPDSYNGCLFIRSDTTPVVDTKLVRKL